MVNRYCISKLIIIVGVLIIFGALLIGMVIVPYSIRSKTITDSLVDGTIQYDRWVNQPFPINFNVYLFEIKNPLEVLNGLEKPNLHQRGPYVYTQTSIKRDIKRDSVYDTLSYKQYYHFEFNQNLSGEYTENDEFYVLNAPLQGSFQIFERMGMAKELEDWWEEAFDGYEIIGPFIKIKVKNFLFDGVKFCTDPTNFMCSIMISSPTTRSRSMKLTEDGALSFSAFGYKQDNHDGEYKIFAGVSDLYLESKVGLITAWENSDTLNIWKAGSCNTVRGRDFTIYPPYIDEIDVFAIFSTDLCRAVTLQYQDQHEYQNIEGQRRFLRRDTLSNQAGNSCYCTKRTANLNGSRTECLPDGFLDMNECMLSPVVVSFPHFLWTTTDISQTVTGLKPEEDKHVTFITIERDTGIPLIGAKRFQYNMVLRPIDGISITTLLNPSMVPLLWTEESFELSGELLETVENYVYDMRVTQILTWVFTILGMVIIIFVVCWYIFFVISPIIKQPANP
ncbi:sensory neuron membrane protein 2-like [Onthophagus taurus]|uniref:sensory neuron membrane protein 2-like n=1 Tax=Onthophagus taurus TaxID=166361 RepID=UPI0039BE34D9